MDTIYIYTICMYIYIYIYICIYLFIYIYICRGILGRGGCSGWGVQWMAGTGGATSMFIPPACITTAGQILDIQIKIASDYTWFPRHPLRNAEGGGAPQILGGTTRPTIPVQYGLVPFYVFVVPLHYSPLLKSTYFRQIVLDKWFPPKMASLSRSRAVTRRLTFAHFYYYIYLYIYIYIYITFAFYVYI